MLQGTEPWHVIGHPAEAVVGQLELGEIGAGPHQRAGPQAREQVVAEVLLTERGEKRARNSAAAG